MLRRLKRKQLKTTEYLHLRISVSILSRVEVLVSSVQRALLVPANSKRAKHSARTLLTHRVYINITWPTKSRSTLTGPREVLISWMVWHPGYQFLITWGWRTRNNASWWLIIINATSLRGQNVRNHGELICYWTKVFSCFLKELSQRRKD